MTDLNTKYQKLATEYAKLRYLLFLILVLGQLQRKLSKQARSQDFPRGEGCKYGCWWMGPGLPSET